MISMDFITRKMRDFRGMLTKEEQSEEKTQEFGRFQSYFEVLYKILGWEEPQLTLTVFLVLNFAFWLVIQLQIRFFGVIFLLALLGFVADTCLENSSCLTKFSHFEGLDEVKNDLLDVILSLKALRKDNPSSFCFGMIVLFLSLSFVAKNMSGYVIFYLILLGIFFIPLVLSKIPPKYTMSFKQFIRSLGSERGVLAEDELIPFISDKDFSRDPDLDSLLTDKTADSINSSLISGLNSMPSHLDAEDKESLEEEDLLPSTSKHGAISLTPGDISSDSDSDNRGIRFESTHFNGDTSSEEDYANNLIFDGRDSAERDVSNLINVAVMGDSLMKVADIIKNAISRPVPSRKESSSDSEFELINSEEANEY